MKIEPNISHGFKIDPIKFQIWKLQIVITSPYESGHTILKGFQKVAAPILKGFFKKQKSGPYLKGISKSSHTYIDGISKKWPPLS